MIIRVLKLEKSQKAYRLQNSWLLKRGYKKWIIAATHLQLWCQQHWDGNGEMGGLRGTPPTGHLATPLHEELNAKCIHGEYAVDDSRSHRTVVETVRSCPKACVRGDKRPEEINARTCMGVRVVDDESRVRRYTRAYICCSRLATAGAISRAKPRC
jgi:hypothetical protein